MMLTPIMDERIIQKANLRVLVYLRPFLLTSTLARGNTISIPRSWVYRVVDYFEFARTEAFLQPFDDGDSDHQERGVIGLWKTAVRAVLAG